MAGVRLGCLPHAPRASARTVSSPIRRTFLGARRRAFRRASALGDAWASPRRAVERHLAGRSPVERFDLEQQHDVSSSPTLEARRHRARREAPAFPVRQPGRAPVPARARRRRPRHGTETDADAARCAADETRTKATPQPQRVGERRPFALLQGPHPRGSDRGRLLFERQVGVGRGPGPRYATPVAHASPLGGCARSLVVPAADGRSRGVSPQSSITARSRAGTNGPAGPRPAGCGRNHRGDQS